MLHLKMHTILFMLMIQKYNFEWHTSSRFIFHNFKGYMKNYMLLFLHSNKNILHSYPMNQANVYLSFFFYTFGVRMNAEWTMTPPPPPPPPYTHPHIHMPYFNAPCDAPVGSVQSAFMKDSRWHSIRWTEYK